MDLIFLWMIAPLLIGPVLIAAGIFGIRFALRRFRAGTRLLAALAGLAGVILILIGLAFTAYILMMLLYAWTHDPPRYE